MHHLEHCGNGFRLDCWEYQIHKKGKRDKHQLMYIGLCQPPQIEEIDFLFKLED